MQKEQKDTVSMYFVRAAVARLPPPALAQVLGVASIPQELLGADQARVPAASFAALWMAVAQALDDEFFGLDRRRMKVGSFALLCHAVLHSDNLGQAVKGLLRGFAVCLDDISASLQVQGELALVVVSNRLQDPEARRFADETFLVMVHGLMCWLVGKRIVLAQAAFTGPAGAQAPEHAVMFSQQLTYGADATAIQFDARLLELGLVQTPLTLKTFLRTAPQSVFLKYRNTHSWTARLRHRLRGSLGGTDWPLLDDVAQEFHVAPTTLRRRLDAEGTSYQGIKDALRRDAAIHSLCNTLLSIPEVAAQLGFQEPSAFRRAFKAWTGVPPSHYRQDPGQEPGILNPPPRPRT